MEKKDMLLPNEIVVAYIIAENLKTLRKKHNLSQVDLAKLTGLSRVTIISYEKMHTSIPVYNIFLIAKALGESPNEILKGCEEVFK